MCNDSSINLTRMFTSVQLLKCLISLFFPFVLVPINTSSPLGKHSRTAPNWPAIPRTTSGPLLEHWCRRGLFTVWLQSRKLPGLPFNDRRTTRTLTHTADQQREGQMATPTLQSHGTKCHRRTNIQSHINLKKVVAEMHTVSHSLSQSHTPLKYWVSKPPLTWEFRISFLHVYNHSIYLPDSTIPL